MSDPALAALIFSAPFLLLSLIWAAHDTVLIVRAVRNSKNGGRQ